MSNLVTLQSQVNPFVLARFAMMPLRNRPLSQFVPASLLLFNLVTVAGLASMNPASAQTLTPDVAQMARQLGLQAGGKKPSVGESTPTTEEESPKTERLAPRLEPLPPNEFQRQIQAVTGLQLPLFGQQLFEGRLPEPELATSTNEPRTTQTARPNFTPSNNGPVSPDYVLGPGDQVGVKVYSASIDLDEQLTITRDGALLLPKIGPIQVAGTRVADLDRKIRSALARVLTDFNVYTAVGRLRGMDIYVTGMARSPGKFSVSGMSTAISALFATGGPSAQGSFRAIEVIRSGTKVATIDLYQFLLNGDMKQDIALRQGDVINIPRAGAQVALLGAAEQPAVYELSSKASSLGALVDLSGGLPPTTDPKDVILERTDPARARPMSLLRLSLDDAGRKTPLQDGDLIRLKPLTLASENAVTLRILGEAPVRVPIRAGDKISDVIPTPDALLTRSYYLRQLKNTQEGAVGQVERAASAESAKSTGASQPADSASLRDKLRESEQLRDLEYKRLRESALSSEVNWERALIERMDPLTLQPLMLGFNLERAIVERAPDENLTLAPGDVITVLRRQDVEGPALRKTRLVRIQGEVLKPGIYQIGTQETLQTLIQRAGGSTPQAYLFGTQLLRDSVRKTQAKNIEDVARQLESKLRSDDGTANLAGVSETGLAVAMQLSARNRQMAQEQVTRLRSLKPSGRVALEMDPLDKALPAITLEDGDEILVPTVPSSIFVAGAVVNENALRFRPGRTLQDALRQAGTLPTAQTDQAFILRADGSAVLPDLQVKTDFWSAGTVSRWLKGDQVQDIALMPGDTVVVPEKLGQESQYSLFMRGLKDWTQVLYQLGLGAAAVRTLK
ncbi:Polysaccharide export protein [Burkholderiales bacterium]